MAGIELLKIHPYIRHLEDDSKKLMFIQMKDLGPKYFKCIW